MTRTAEMNDILPKIMHLEPPNTVAHVMFLRYNAYMEAGITALPSDGRGGGTAPRRP